MPWFELHTPHTTLHTFLCMTRPLSILFAPFGSEGDVRPVLWLAGGLAARGHRITFVITPYYKHLVEARGWPALAIGSADEFAAGMRNPRLWQPRAGSELVMEIMLESLSRYAAVLDAANETFDLVVGTTLGTGVFTWAESRRIPRLMLHLQPMCLRSVHDCPLFLESLEWLCRSPRWVKRGMFRVVDRVLTRKLLPAVNAHRQQAGLPPLRRVFADLWNGADGVAALFPDWYAAPQPDWPENLRQFGFPREAPPANPPALAPAMEKFLAEGAPPILWTHGSANLDTNKFAAVAQAATNLLGGRGILVGPGVAETAATKDFLTAKPLPFAQIFGRCRAVVHHGGIGTSVQALAAGVPQLIVPRAHDQPDNARRLERLGVGARLRYDNFSTATAVARLRGLLDLPANRAACRLFQEKVAADNSLSALCDWAEILAANYRL